MAVGHRENIVRLENQLRRQHAAALAGNINPQFLDRLHRVGAGGLTFHRAQTGRQNAIISASLNNLAENAFGHGTATDIACANKEDSLHQKYWLKLSPPDKIVNPECIRVNPKRSGAGAKSETVLAHHRQPFQLPVMGKMYPKRKQTLSPCF